MAQALNVTLRRLKVKRARSSSEGSSSQGEALMAQAGKLKLRREMRGLGLNARDVWHEMWGLRWEMTGLAVGDDGLGREMLSPGRQRSGLRWEA